MKKITVTNSKCKSQAIVDIACLMQNTQFRYIYDRYMKNWNDIESAVMFMKLYEEIEIEMNKKQYIQCVSSNKRQAIPIIIEHLFKYPEYRQTICSNMHLFIHNKYKKLKF